MKLFLKRSYDDQCLKSARGDSCRRKGPRPSRTHTSQIPLAISSAQEFAALDGHSYITGFGVDAARRFRAAWPNKNIAARKKLEAFRALFRFVHESGWTSTNPTTPLKPPKTQSRQTDGATDTHCGRTEMVWLVCLSTGIATLVNSVEKDAMAAKGLLRHASVTTTQNHYIKEVPEITQKAMGRVETLRTNGSKQTALRC